MNGFEWRWVAAGIGWGTLVGAATGTLIGWVVLFTAVGPSDTSVAEQIAGALIGLLYMAFYGSLLGSSPASAVVWCSASCSASWWGASASRPERFGPPR